MGRMVDIWTLGFEGRSPADILRTLEEYRIERVLDVRATPVEDSGFNKAALESAVSKAGMAYDLRRELAPKREIRDAYRGTGDYEAFAAAYASDLAKKAVEMAGHTAKGQRTCLVSTERDPYRSHRVVLGDALEKIGFRVHHIA